MHLSESYKKLVCFEYCLENKSTIFIILTNTNEISPADGAIKYNLCKTTLKRHFKACSSLELLSIITFTYLLHVRNFFVKNMIIIYIIKNYMNAITILLTEENNKKDSFNTTERKQRKVERLLNKEYFVRIP